MRVVAMVATEAVGPVPLLAVTMSVYAVENWRPVKVTVCEARALLMDGVAGDPLSV